MRATHSAFRTVISVPGSSRGGETASDDGETGYDDEARGSGALEGCANENGHVLAMGSACRAGASACDGRPEEEESTPCRHPAKQQTQVVSNQTKHCISTSIKLSKK